MSEKLDIDVRKNRFPKKPKACPDYNGIHKKRNKKVYESYGHPFKALGSIAEILSQKSQYQNLLITEDTLVCEYCFTNFEKLIEEDRVEASQEYALIQSTPSGESEPLVSQNYNEKECLCEELNTMRKMYGYKLSPFKHPEILTAPKEDYCSRKRKRLMSEFFDKTDFKLRKLYDVSEQKIEFENCKNCGEFYDNINSVIGNKDIQYSQKIKLMTLMPKGMSRESVLKNLPNVTHHMVTQSRKVLSTKGLYSEPDPYVGHPIDQKTLDTVLKYFLDDDMDCSKQSPNKNDVMKIKMDGVAQEKVKRFLTRSMQEIFTIFKEKNPNLKISRSKFYKLRPKWVKIQPFTNACVCVYCANFDLLLVTLKNLTQTKPSKLEDLKNKILLLPVCADSDDECFMQECKKCPGKQAITSESLGFSEYDESEDVTFATWEKNDLIKKTTSLENFVKELKDCVVRYNKHTFIKKTQQEAIRFEKRMVVISKKRLAINCDWAENWTVIMKDAIQGYHWTNKQISIFTAVCYIGADTISFAVISDDRSHDTAATLLALERIQETMENLYPETIEEITIVTDGAAAHFKNRYQFFELGSRSHLCPKWIFSATGHGKCACDGVGGLCKHYATKHNLMASELDCVKNALDFVEKIQKYTDSIQLLLMDDERLPEFRKSKKEAWASMPEAAGIRSNHTWEVVEKIFQDKKEKHYFMQHTPNHSWINVKF